MRPAWLLRAFAVSYATVMGCVGDSTIVNDGGADATSDAGVDAPSESASDAPSESASDASTTVYSSLTDQSKWSTFDMTTVAAGAKGCVGAAFDGRYVYFVPKFDANGTVARYDTTATFNTGSSWSSFQAVSVNARSRGFQGAAFDGRYVYFVPNFDGTSQSGLVTRYDTQGAFTTAGSWTSFDVATVNANATGFLGATFDGRYVYFAPEMNGTGFDGVVTRYDSQSPFGTGTSWTTFDTAVLTAAAIGFGGATFDGRYVYFVPQYNTTHDGLVVKYDTTATFGSQSSWTTFDMTTVHGGAAGFFGGVFDGRYAYFVPNHNAVTFDGLVGRYDTTAPFATVGSWSTFDTTTVEAGAAGFVGGAFDGRYVYFVPHDNGVYDGIVSRYDTQANFTMAGSWTTFDISTVNPAAVGFWGAAFDGRYVYFVPNFSKTVESGLVARFDAKTPAALPPYAHGSFF
jgi:hypothetical protein